VLLGLGVRRQVTHTIGCPRKPTSQDLLTEEGLRERHKLHSEAADAVSQN